MKTAAKIFDELVAMDPSLAPHKKEIMKAIKALQAERPDTNFDEKFAKDLRKQFMAEVMAPDASPSFFERVKTHFAAHLRIYSWALASLVLLVGGFYGFQYFLSAPAVVAGNWSFEYKKIPYDVPSIDITFSKDLDPGSVTKETVKFAPYVEGEPTVKDGNILSYKLSSKLKVGDRYSVTLSGDIKSRFGAKIGRDITYEIEAIAGAKAMRVLPEWSLANVSRNIVTLFNIPMVPLSSLNQKDNLPCPIEITPAVPGACKWTSGTVLEYVPTEPLKYATRYEVKIASKDGLLYPLSETKVVQFETPRLAWVDEGVEFSPIRGIPVRFNTPVKTDDLAKAIKVQENGKDIAVTVVTETGSTDMGRRFLVNAQSGPGIGYSTTYAVTLSGWLMPAEGNLALTGTTKRTYRSNDFMLSLFTHRAVYSGTGALIDTWQIEQAYSGTVNRLPSNHPFFVMEFGEDVDLAMVKPYLATKDARIDCKLSYMKNESQVFENGKQVTKVTDDKRRIKCEIEPKLADDTAYALTIDQASNPHLRANEVYNFKTAPKFVLSDFTYVSNTEACVYSTSPLSLDPYGGVYGKEEHFETEPKSPVRSVMKDSVGTYNPMTGRNTEKLLCKEIPGKTAYVLGTRFTPGQTYTLRAKPTLDDALGNRIAEPFEVKGIKAGPVKEEDKYVYSPLAKDVNVIPDNLPIIANFQTINLDRLTVSVCQTDLAGYSKYLMGWYQANFVPSCIGEEKTVTLPVTNRAWSISNNRFDLEKDIMGWSFSSPFVIVRGTVNGRYNQNEYGYREEWREFINVYVRAGMALAVESGKNKQYALLTSTDGKQVIEGATIRAFTRDDSGNIKEASGFKSAYLASKKLYELTGDFHLLIAEKSGKYAVITMDRDQASNYDFGYVSGQSSTATKDFAFIYTDRPIYRPGDTVEFKGLLRTFEPTGYVKSKNTSGKVKIVKEDGTLFKELPVTLDGNSNFHGSFGLPNNVNLGRFNFELYVKGGNAQQYTAATEEGAFIYNDAYFHVDAYKKPTFKVNVSSDKRDRLLGDSAKVGVESEYYFGGKMVNTNFHYTVLQQNYFFDAKKYSDYQFGRWYEYFDCVYWGFCSYGDRTVASGDGKIDENGHGTFAFDYPKEATDPNNPDVSNGEKLYTYNVEVRDPDTAKTVNNTYTEVLHTTDGYVGLRSGYSYPKNSDIRVEGVILSHDAVGKKGAKATIEVVRREWKVAKKQGVDGIFYDDYSVEEKKEKDISVTGNDVGEFQTSFRTQGDGEYEIRAHYTGANGKTFTSSRIIYVASDSYMLWNNGNNSITDLVAEKGMLKPGETAVLTLKSPVKSGKYFVSIEKDDAILDSYVKDITSYAERIELPIQASHIPNAYVKVYLIGQDEKMELPVYKRALAVIKVTSDDKKLSVEVIPTKGRYLPGDAVEVTVRVKDSAWNPVANANGSLSIVDESVLALLGNPQKNPFAFFYDMKRYLGVSTYLSFTNLIEKLEVKNTGNGEKGGAGEGQKWGDAKKKRGLFKDTAYWKSDFTTDSNGEAKIAADKLPDNLTTWVIESVVSTPADNKVGVGRSTIMTTKPLLVSENLPRFLVSGDRVILAPVIFNKTGKGGEVRVTATAENADIAKSEVKAYVNDGESAVFRFEISPHSNPENKTDFASKITFKAVDSNGNEDTVENVLPIMAPSTAERTATVGKTADTSHDERLSLDGLGKDARLEITYSPSLLGTLAQGVNFLEQYPYYGSEPRTSALVPSIEMKKLHTAIGEEYDLSKITTSKYVDVQTGYVQVPLRETMLDYIGTIANFQKNDGGFVYWEDTKDKEVSDFRLSSYIVRTLADLKSLGFTIDSKLQTNAVKYLKDRFYAGVYEGCKSTKDYDCKYPEGFRLAAIESILAMVPNDADALKMYKLIDASKLNPSDTFVSLRTIAVLVVQQNLPEVDKKTLETDAKNRIDNILKNDVVVNPRGAFVGGYGEYSRIENTASFVEAVSLLGKEKFVDIDTVIDGMNRFLLGSKKPDGSYGSTQETAAIVRSLATYLAKSGELKDVDMVVRLKADAELLAEKRISGAERFETQAHNMPASDLPRNSTVTFEKDGKWTVYYDLSLSYTVPTKDIQARDEGFFVDTSYYLLSDYQKIKALKEEEWGKYVRGEIEYGALKYPKDVVDYLAAQTKFKVGDLVYVHNRVISSEARKQAAFEGFVPSGSELVNTNLATETKQAEMGSSVNQPTSEDSRETLATPAKIFDREEFRDDRYFGTTSVLEGGDYGFSYTIRMTHAGDYSVPPARAFELNNSEVFGRSAGKEISVE